MHPAMYYWVLFDLLFYYIMGTMQPVNSLLYYVVASLPVIPIIVYYLSLMDLATLFWGLADGPMASHWLAVALLFVGEPLASPSGLRPRVSAVLLYDCQLFPPHTISVTSNPPASQLWM